jgi:hypothetical protein
MSEPSLELASTAQPLNLSTFQPSEDRPSREFPVSSFSLVFRNPTVDYHEYIRVLDSIKARLNQIKIDYARSRGLSLEEAFPPR